jgi:hypothetical protein
MSKYGISILFAFLVSSITGCDFIHGVSHVRLDSPTPDIKCLENAVTAVPGVTKFEYRNEEGGRPLTMHGIEKPNQIHRFFYQYSGLNGNFYFLVNYKGEAEFRHTYIDINRTPPQRDIDTIRPVMFEIENEIEKQCGLVGFSAQVIEECMGVECD